MIGQPAIPDDPANVGVRRIPAGSPEAAAVLAKTEAHYAELKAEHPEVWAEIERNRTQKPDWAW